MKIFKMFCKNHHKKESMECKDINIHTFDVPLNEVALGIPYDPNLRYPDRKSPVYKVMYKSAYSVSSMTHWRGRFKK